MTTKIFNAESAGITIGPLIFDMNKRVVFINHKEMIFQKKEFEILYFFVNNPGRAFSREMLLKEIWGSGVYVEKRTIDVHIRKIREKLESYADYIETIKGFGYRFKSVK